MDIYQKLKEIFLVVVILVGLLSLSVINKWSASFYPTRAFTISAEGKATVVPDIANVSFSVVSEGSDPERLQTDNNDKMTKAVDFVKSLGVDSKDIKTTNYNLSPRYEYDEKTRRSYISGYTLTQTASVKVRDLSKVAKILGGLSNSGVNLITGPSFGVEDPEKYLGEAKKQAFEKALTKAKEMASQNGVKIKKVLNFSEFQSGPIPYYRTEGLGGGGDFAKASLPTIEPGTQEVTVQVSVTYEIE